MILHVQRVLHLVGASYFCMCTIYAEKLLVGKLDAIFVFSLVLMLPGRCFHASAVKQKRTALFWVIAQRVVVISYRQLEFVTPEGVTDKWSRNVGEQLPPI